MRSGLVLAWSVVALVSLASCSSDDEGSSPASQTPTGGTATETPGKDDSPGTGADDPGPPPAGCPDITKDEDGFFVRDSGKSAYVGYVPKGYAGKPTRLLVGLHGCGDTASSFAGWGVAPWEQRESQEHIAIAVDGATGNGNCWNVAADEEKALAAIDDITKCFYVHKKKVVLAGYSSGGILAYALGMKHAARFAGILILNSGLGKAPFESAAWKLHVAHRAHTNDDAFPLAKVKEDWAKLQGAGFPIETNEAPGNHDGSDADWTEWLLPRMASWVAP